MAVIRGRQLTTVDIAPDGESFSLHVMDEQSQPASLVLPAECLNALIMTLPAILRRSLQLRFGGDAMRVVYPVAVWKIDASTAAGSVVVTLRTPDGFEVSFSLPALDLLRMATQGASRSAAATGIIFG